MLTKTQSGRDDGGRWWVPGGKKSVISGSGDWRLTASFDTSRPSAKSTFSGTRTPRSSGTRGWLGRERCCGASRRRTTNDRGSSSVIRPSRPSSAGTSREPRGLWESDIRWSPLRPPRSTARICRGSSLGAPASQRRDDLLLWSPETQQVPWDLGVPARAHARPSAPQWRYRERTVRPAGGGPARAAGAYVGRRSGADPEGRRGG